MKIRVVNLSNSSTVSYPLILIRQVSVKCISERLYFSIRLYLLSRLMASDTWFCSPLKGLSFSFVFSSSQRIGGELHNRGLEKTLAVLLHDDDPHQGGGRQEC